MKRLQQILFCLFVSVGAFAQSDTPPNGAPGKCYAKCMIPDQYESTTEQIETRPAYNKTDVVVPNLASTTRRVMIKAAGSKLAPTPPALETVTEQVLVKAESKKLVPIPAQYESYTERVEVKPAVKRLITVPGQYETITDQQWYVGTTNGISYGRGTNPSGFSPSDLQSVGDALARDGGLDANGNPTMVSPNGSSANNPNSPNNPNGANPSNPNGKSPRGTNPNNPNGANPSNPNGGGNDGNGGKYGGRFGAGNLPASNASDLSMVGTIMPYLVQTASIKVDRIPMSYETVTDRVMVSPVSSKWEKKRVDKNCLSVDPNDCLIWCLVEIPAEYKTITKQKAKGCAQGYMQSSIAGTDKEECIRVSQIPAQYGPRQIVKVAPSVKEEVIPAEYKTITKQRVVKEASVREEVIPAEYATITKQVLKTDAGYVRQVVPAEYKTVPYTYRSGLQLKPGYRWTNFGLVYNPNNVGSGISPNDPSGTGVSPSSPNGKRPRNSNGQPYDPNNPNDPNNPSNPNYKGGNGNGGGNMPGSGSPLDGGGFGTGSLGAMIPGDVPADPLSAEPYSNWDSAGCPAGYSYNDADKVCKKDVNVPAQYATVSKKSVSRKGGFSEWREVVCNSDITVSMVKQVQRALRDRGYDPGPDDNILGARTKAALVQFQKDKGLPSGNLNIETLNALNVKQ
jgi:Putative peptidoglycan binding domain